MKLFYDKRHSERVFEVGDWVYMNLQAYRQQSVEKRLVPKLTAKYYGPFEVIEKIGSVAYKLNLPTSTRIHPVFHVSLLKKKVGQQVVVNPHLPPMIDPKNSRWYPAKVLDTVLFAEDIKARYPEFEIDG